MSQFSILFIKINGVKKKNIKIKFYILSTRISFDTSKRFATFVHSTMSCKTCAPELSPESFANLTQHAVFPHGTRTLYFGPMGAGKTDRLISIARKHVLLQLPFRANGDLNEAEEMNVARRTLLFITHASTTEKTRVPGYGTIVSHDGKGMKVRTTTFLMPLITDNHYKEVSTIFVDEGQFFPDLASFVRQCRLDKKTLFVGALNSNVKHKSWKHVTDAMPEFNRVELLSSYCRNCPHRYPATTTVLREKAIVVESLAASGPDDFISVGGFDNYTVVCDKCYEGIEAEMDARKPVN